MKNISKLKIKNFQSHVDTEIEFSPYITTFVGSSDSGKTAILRSLDFVLNNKPRGTGFITNGKSKTDVEVIFTDNSSVRRERGKTVNKYYSKDTDGNKQIYADFGVNVPKEIMALTEHSPIPIDPELEIDLNFSKQLESAFLISKPDAIKAKVLDGVARINVFNRALKNTNSKISSLKSEDKNIDQRLSEINEELKHYDDLTHMQSNLEKMKTIIEELDALQKRKELLSSLYDRYEELNNELMHTKKIINQLSTLKDAELLYSEMTILYNKKANMERLLQEDTYIANEIAEATRIKDSLKNIYVAEEIYRELFNLYNKQEKLNLLLVSSERIAKEIADSQKIVAHKLNLLSAEALLKEITDLFNKRTSMISLGTEYFNLDKEIKKNKTDKEKLKDITKAEDVYNEILSLVQLRDRLINFDTQCNNFNSSISKERKTVQEIQVKLDKEKEKYKEALKQFSKCPICFTHLDEAKMNNIVKNL